MNTVLNYVLYFFAYSAIGWLIESIYVSIAHRKITNRGFLKGPMCPIYGTGATVFAVCLGPAAKMGNPIFIWNFFVDDRTVVITDKIWLVILLGMVLADTVEFITSVLMEKLFHARWWDYSDKFLNIQGRICLRHTLYWGLMCSIFIYVVHPFMTKFVFSYVTDNPTVRNITVGVIFAVFIVDTIFSAIAAMDVGKFMSKLENLSDSIYEVTATLKTNIEHKYEELQNSAAESGQKFSAWTADVNNRFSELKHYFDRSDDDTKARRKTRRNAKRVYESFGNMTDRAKKTLSDIESQIKELTDKDNKEK